MSRKNRDRRKKKQAVHSKQKTKIWNYLAIGILLTLPIIALLTSNTQNETGVQTQVRNRPQLPYEPHPAPLVSKNEEQEIEALLKDRRSIRDQWLASAEDIATKANDQEALEVVAHLKKNSPIAIPIPSPNITPGHLEIGTIEPSSPGFVLPMVILRRHDHLPNQNWIDLVNSKVIGIFQPVDTEGKGSGFIVLKDFWPLSSVEKGLIMIHEGKHALDNFFQQSTGFNWQKEKTAFGLQFRVTEAIGGKAYQAALQNEIARLKEKGSFDGSALAKFWVTGKSVYRSELDVVFGPLTSDVDRIGRANALQIHASLELIKIRFGDKAPIQEEAFLNGIYK